MKNKRQKIIVMIILTLFISIFTNRGMVANAGAAGSFTIKAMIPDNQVDKRLSYFDLRLQPGEKQTIQVLIKNSGSNSITANAELNAAATGSNGIIVYNLKDVRDESMKISITDIAKIRNPQIEIAGNSEAYAEIDIEMPEQAFDGVILGGITVTADSQGGVEDETEEGIQVENQYAYTLGLKITENDNEIAPNLNLKYIKPELVNYHTSIIAGIQNDQPLIMSKMNITGELYKKGASEILYEAALDPASIAPNSTLDFVIDCKNEALNPGTYRLYLKAVYGDKIWEWDEEFEITAKEANEINKEAVNVAEAASNLWIYLLIILLLIIIILTGYFAYKIGRKKSH